jgi:hypothetical protein
MAYTDEEWEKVLYYVDMIGWRLFFLIIALVGLGLLTLCLYMAYRTSGVV